MSDLENVLRRLARLLQPAADADDAARVADDAEQPPDAGEKGPGDQVQRSPSRDLPHPDAATG